MKRSYFEGILRVGSFGWNEHSLIFFETQTPPFTSLTWIWTVIYLCYRKGMLHSNICGCSYGHSLALCRSKSSYLYLHYGHFLKPPKFASLAESRQYQKVWWEDIHLMHCSDCEGNLKCFKCQECERKGEEDIVNEGEWKAWNLRLTKRGRRRSKRVEVKYLWPFKNCVLDNTLPARSDILTIVISCILCMNEYVYYGNESVNIQSSSLSAHYSSQKCRCNSAATASWRCNSW